MPRSKDKPPAPVVKCEECGQIMVSLAALTRHRVLRHSLGKR